MEMARCLLIDSGLPKTYWEYAVKMAAYLRNRTTTTANSENQSPYEVFHGKVPNLSGLPIFGARIEVHIPDEMRDKLSQKSRTCVFLRVTDGTKALIYEDEKTRKGFISRDGHWQQIRSPGSDGARCNRETESASDSYPEGATDLEERIEERRQSGRLRKPREFLMHEQQLGASLVPTHEEEEPKSSSEALSDKRWVEAMENEYKALVKNETWNLVPKPKDRNVISGKWCFKIKKSPDGNIIRRKAKYVARGFTQQPGIDFDETFSPVMTLTTMRAIVAVATQENMVIKQIDIDNAYLYGELEEELYLEQSDGSEQTGANGKQQVCRLRKAIYGLKQAGRVWWKQLDTYVRGLGFKSSEKILVCTLRLQAEKRKF